MPHINLIPWREEKRIYSKKEFLAILGGIAIIAIVLVGLVHLSMMRVINTQNSINSYLKNELNSIVEEINKGKKLEDNKKLLLGYVGELNNINQRRITTTLLLNQLVMAVPDGIYLSRLARKDNVVEIDGIADSNTNVSQFMRNMESAKEVQEAILSRIQNTEQSGQGINNFTVNLVLNITPSKKTKGSRR